MAEYSFFGGYAACQCFVHDKNVEAYLCCNSSRRTGSGLWMLDLVQRSPELPWDIRKRIAEKATNQIDIKRSLFLFEVAKPVATVLFDPGFARYIQA